MSASYDLIVIGGGHNGLVTAAYLARAGVKVLVLERRDVLGGACVTEELWPGFKVSTAAYVNSLLRREIIHDLELKRHGFRMLPRNPSSFTPFPDGRSLMLGPNKPMTHREVAKFSAKDADALPKYEAMLERVAAFIDRWFESEELKVTLATDAIIGAMASPSMPGTAYVLFHHVMGECDGVRGVWGYVRGGMGGISNAIASAAREKGAEIRTNSEVTRILVKGGEAVGVVLKGGTEIRARRVASGADANITFLKLLETTELPPEFVDAVRAIDYSSASLKINISLTELPDFKAVPGNEPGPQHRGTIHISPTMEYIERAYDTAKYGCPSEYPIIEATIPSVLDDTLAPPGKHVMSMFTQYFPYKLAPGLSLQEEKEKYAERCFDLMNEYAPNFRRSVIGRQVLAPTDLEKRFGLTGGNIMQGTMSLSSLSFMRPVPGYADYRTPIRGLYLCGAATHPGGGVMGACGYNAAREILRDLRRR
jgi:phytoene dehydrogenase-like protein